MSDANKNGEEKAEIKTPKVETVTLKKKGKESTQEFQATQAIRLLTMKNSGWELKDKKFTFDGIELKKA